MSSDYGFAGENLLEIEGQIERLIVDDGDFAQLEAEFDNFCPFEALGLVRAEIRHGNLLAYLLNPLRPHGFNTAILRSFLLAVARNVTVPRHGSILKPLDVHLLDFQDAEIRREWRNIDLLIILRSTRLVIPIELKIDSSQGREQLKRYRAIVETAWKQSDGWKHVCVFLTKNEEEPEDSEHWSSLQLEELALELEAASAASGDSPHGASLLQAYLKMLRRHHLNDERLNELARKLWARHGEALAFLADHRPDAIGNLFASLRDRRREMATHIGSPSRQVSVDSDQANVIRFAFERWETLRGFKTSRWTESKRLILLELKREGSKLTSYLYLGPGSGTEREEYAVVLDKHRLHRPTSRAGRDWMCLAKRELFKSNESDDIDIDHVSGMIIKSVEAFAADVFQHFDPLFEPFRKALVLDDDASLAPSFVDGSV